MKEFADDNFKLDEKGRNLSKRVENTVGKREIARYEGRQKVSLCGNGLTHYQTTNFRLVQSETVCSRQF